MAGLAGSLASTGRQSGTTLGVAISGTIIGPALARGGPAFTSAAHGVWWMILALGAAIVVLGLVSTGRWASRTTKNAAAMFDRADPPAARMLSRSVRTRARTAMTLSPDPFQRRQRP
jgi:hypothetical protein